MPRQSRHPRGDHGGAGADGMRLSHRRLGRKENNLLIAGDLCFADERRAWEASADIGFTATIDCEHPQWGGGCVGLVPNVLEEQELPPENTVAVTCGPPVMIRYALRSLEKMGFGEEQIYTTLERRMKCGIGICGRCNVGAKYVCTDGPVFSLAQLGEMPDEL